MADAPVALVSRQTLARQIYQLLLGRILEGSLRPGTRLVEAEIATSVGTSRGPVREAIAMLQRAGLVHADAFVGATILQPSERDIVEIYSLRSVLEGYAAGLVVKRQEPGYVEALRAVTAKMRETCGPRVVARLRELDGEFHGTLVRLAGDQELWQTWERLRTKVALYLSVVEDAFRDGPALAAMHELLVTALLTADPAKAELDLRSQLIANGHEWTTRARPPGRPERDPALS